MSLPRFAMAAAVTILCGPALAGDNNVAFLNQIGTGPVGNTIAIDQSRATGALVAGDRLAITPALQAGDGNAASLVIAGSGGTAILSQSNVLAGGAGNTVELSLAGTGAFGATRQAGSGNTAALTVTSDLTPTALGPQPATGSILQIGNRNDARLEVQGVNVSGELVQIGNGNRNDLTVGGLGADGIQVTFTQIGNNLNSTGASVFSNAGTVLVTQTAFGTFQN